MSETPKSDPKEVAKRVQTRRWKRRLKAGVALVIAGAAGTFLACMRGDRPRTIPAPNPHTDEVSNLPAPPRDAGVPDAAPSTATAIVLAPPDAGADTGIAQRIRERVDHDQHQRGMPVPDNLLE